MLKISAPLRIELDDHQHRGNTGSKEATGGGIKSDLRKHWLWVDG
jgi:hypothetical protein